MNKKQALVCSYHIVQPDRDSGARRVYHLLGFLLEAGWEVTFLAADGVGDERDVKRLQQLGVAVYDGYRDTVEGLFTAAQFDLALIAFWPNAERYVPSLRKLSPFTRVIVDSVDLHFLRESRRVFSEAGAREGTGLLGNKLAQQWVSELNTYAAAETVLTVSQKEADLINDMLCNPTLARVVPDCEDLAPSDVPFAERRGLVCLGSFQHGPNVQAVRHLCSEILPRIDPALLAEHPVYVVGNAMDATHCTLANGLPDVKMVGWVPCVLPYLERARVSVVPLLFGAGTKRKLMQALAVGTPTVSTSIGVEGFNLCAGEHVLVADEPAAFAEATARLLQDEQLWNRLAATGREFVTRTHGMAAAKERFLAVIDHVLARPPRPAMVAYDRLVPQVRAAAAQHTPAGATLLVVSKGDPELLKIEGRTGRHFPQGADGGYAGHYPKDSADAIAHLEALRQKGAGYVVFPKPAFWWLDHYAEFKQHLETCHALVIRNPVCVIYQLRPASNGSARLAAGEATARPSAGVSQSSIAVGQPSAPATVSAPANPAAVRLIAFYLPQFHPIPENNAWWGEGFTEWRNVAKADPQFPGHYQPHVPADLGFYDLRLAETREEQAALARRFGIHGFCYYHYWFSGKRLLERPFREILASGKPDFPFCLCWANDPWSRRWDGREDELLQAQTYSEEDDANHIRTLLSALTDRRAINVDGKPVFLVYRGKHLPNPARTTAIWRKQVKQAGLKGLYLVAVETAWDLGWDATQVGFDAKVLFQPQFGRLITHAGKNGARIPVPGKDKLQVYDYPRAVAEMLKIDPVSYRRFETVCPNWDNTARVGEKAVVLHNTSPEAYEEWLRGAIARTASNPPSQQLVFLNAWNEWAEGCHLEPDHRHGHAYLRATVRALNPSSHSVPRNETH